MLAYLPQTGIITIDGFHFNNELEVTMSQSVTIKKYKYGINLVLDPEIGFDELFEGCCRKVQSIQYIF